MKNLIHQLKSRALVRNSIVSGFLKPLSMLLSYAYVPIVLHYLGEEMYGAWTTILSVLSWISYFDIGIGNGLRNKLTESIALKETDRSKKLVSSAYLMLAAVVLAAGTVMITVSAFLNWNRILGLTTEYKQIKLVVLLSMLFVCVNFVLSLCRVVMFSLQKAAMAGFMDICSQLISLLGVIVISSFTTGNLLLVGIVSGGSTAVSCLLFSAVLYSRHKELAPSVRMADRTVGKEVSMLGVQFFVIQICGLVLFSTDNLIISNLYGAENVTPYSIVNKLFTAVITVHAAVLTPFWSALTKAKAEKQSTQIKKITRFSLVLMLPFMCGAVFLALIFRPLTTLWLHEELECSDLMIWLGAVYCVIYIWANTFGILSNGMNIVKGPMIVAVIQATVNIPLSLYLAVNAGMQSEGILLGTIISMMISAASVPFFFAKKTRKEFSVSK
ncbi:MAG: hypothetical protein J6S92_06165 [Oscillospiraceae bacterium]|nr:hypothetical protein [Oscillospiraceae bacterium]